MSENNKLKINTITEYMAQFPEDKISHIQKMRACIASAAPEATEKISWQMPTYYYYQNAVHFAIQKNHIGFYPSPEAIIAFQDKLSAYKTTKGGVQFPFSKPIPYPLIQEITAWRMAQIKEQFKQKIEKDRIKNNKTNTNS